MGLQQKSSISQCVGFAWRFREWSRSSQRIQNPGSRWIHCGGGPSSRGFGEAWEGRPANGQSQVSGTLSFFFPKHNQWKVNVVKVAFVLPERHLKQTSTRWSEQIWAGNCTNTRHTLYDRLVSDCNEIFSYLAPQSSSFWMSCISKWCIQCRFSQVGSHSRSPSGQRDPWGSAETGGQMVAKEIEPQNLKRLIALFKFRVQEDKVLSTPACFAGLRFESFWCVVLCL